MADEKDDGAEVEQPIIIKKIVKGGGHHGGAWKVAYADFVTAMMAFFLLMWLLNVSTDEQLQEIANYFDPAVNKVSDSKSGAGGVLGGLSMSPVGAMATMRQPISSPRPTGAAVNNRSAKKQSSGDETQTAQELATEPEQSEAEKVLRQQEQDTFEETKKILEDAIQNDDALKELADNLIIDITPEGLRIQIVDEKGRPMFASGSANMYDLHKQLITKVTTIIKDLPNQLSVRGHTDSTSYGKGATYTNWELSSDRANSARREILKNKFPADKIRNIIGRADTEHLVKDTPNSPRNRRISIVLLKEELTNPAKFAEKANELLNKKGEAKEGSKPSSGKGGVKLRSGPKQVPVGTFKRSPGAVEFP